MTDLVQSDVAPYVPPGRPVPKFMLLIGLVAVALIALAVAGPFRARVDVLVPQWQVEGDRAVALIAVSNSGNFAVEASALRGDGLLEPAPFRRLIPETDGADLDAGEVVGSVRIEPNETINVAVVIVPDCDRYPAHEAPGPEFEIHVTVELGMTRVVRVRETGASVTETICNPA